jgi:hypothetical protein
MYSPFNPNGVSDSGFLNDAQQRRDQAKGSAFSPMATSNEWERCIVHSVYPDRYTCDVFTEKGRYLAGVPWPGTEGEVRSPRRGARMGVHFNLGTPQLQLVNAGSATALETGEEFRVGPQASVGGEDPVYTAKGSNNARGALPRDVLPGDWLQVGELGNFVGVLNGGMTALKASELAQIIATQARNMLKLVGQNMSLYTGAGEIDFKTVGGKTSMVMRLGADNETESDPSADNFRIRCEVGDEGELVNFRVTDGKGRNVYCLHVDPDGRVQREALRETTVIAESQTLEVGQDVVQRIGRNHLSTINGAMVVDVKQGMGAQIGGAWRVRATGDAGLSAVHDVSVNSGRNMRFSAGGDTAGSAPALQYTVANGDVAFDIGNPLAGDTQARGSGYTVDTRTGKIRMESALGAIELSAPAGFVKVGGNAANARFHAVLFETLNSFFKQFGGLVDNHTHVCPAASAPTGTPLPKPWLGSKALLKKAKSKKVKLGG